MLYYANKPFSWYSEKIMSMSVYSLQDAIYDKQTQPGVCYSAGESVK